MVYAIGRDVTPRLRVTPPTIGTRAAAPTFDEAAETAVRAMIPLLMARHGVSETDAYMLCSIRGDLRVNQACRSPIDTSVRFEFPKV